MTAGRGVIHSEMPEQDQGRMAGFQLWLNLPAKDKMTAPWYRDIQSEAIPELVTEQGVRVRVIAGSSHGVQGAMQRAVTQPLYLDVHLPAGASIEQTLPAHFNAFVYVYEGELVIGERLVPQQRMAILKKSAQADGVVMQATSATTETRALLIAGQPLNETIVQYGPFVMNSQAEILQAIHDFQAGKLVSGD